jgi:hypothetical protein
MHSPLPKPRTSEPTARRPTCVMSLRNDPPEWTPTRALERILGRSKKLRPGYRQQRLLDFGVQGGIDVQRCIHDLQILECALCRPRLRSKPPTGKESAVAPLTGAGRKALAALRAQHRGRYETR